MDDELLGIGSVSLALHSRSIRAHSSTKKTTSYLARARRGFSAALFRLLPARGLSAVDGDSTSVVPRAGPAELAEYAGGAESGSPAATSAGTGKGLLFAADDDARAGDASDGNGMIESALRSLL